MKPNPLLVAATFAGALGPAWAADHARAEEIVQGSCFVCHGVEGEKSSPVFPRLAGQNAQYVARQLADYKSGKRAAGAMRPMFEDLTPADFQALGAYYESRKPRAHEVEDPALAQMGRLIFQRGNPYSGVTACADCHGPAGHGSEMLPRLAGQHPRYTENQIKSFARRERAADNPVMFALTSKLTELEIKAVAVYIGGLE